MRGWDKPFGREIISSKSKSQASQVLDYSHGEVSSEEDGDEGGDSQWDDVSGTEEDAE